MAQLNTSKEKYGVSVATRIESEIAHQIADRAENLGISFSKMVGMLLVKGFQANHSIIDTQFQLEESEERITQLETEIEELTSKMQQQAQLYNSAASEFIVQTAFSDEQRINLVELYKSILDEKRNQRT